ncbi:MAG: shikimate kinase [Planctomycetota bacterium]|nr:shikimate kinase [Planctomycetota bacterium]
MERVALIGLPGSGKSTVGALLASRIGYRFLDVDQELEKQSGWSAARWIHEKGLPAFRAAEALFVATATDRHDARVVMATGGGVVEMPENRQYLSLWRCFWLDASHPILIERSQQQIRPLLEGGSRSQLLEQLRRDREPLYRQLCAEALETDGISPSMVVDAILSRLEEDL